MLDNVRKCVSWSAFELRNRAQTELDSLEADIQKRIDAAVKRVQERIDAAALTTSRTCNCCVCNRIMVGTLTTTYCDECATGKEKTVVAEAMAKEKERVIAYLNGVIVGSSFAQIFANDLYPPPAPKKLPAGAYWCKSPSRVCWTQIKDADFEPWDDCEYVPIPSMEECRKIAKAKIGAAFKV